MMEGVFTPAITVFDEEGRIDYKGNEKLIEHLIDGGISGILFLGSIGEFFTLRMEEKKEFIRFVVKTVERRVPVLVGTGNTSIDEVMELTSFAEREKADAAVVISPYYFKLDEESLYRHYAEVARTSTIPLLLYNFPDRTAVNMSPELILRLAQEFPNIIGIKDTLDSISHTRSIIQAVKPHRNDFSIFSGFDEYLIPNLMTGGSGLIGGLSNIAPHFFKELYEAYHKNDFMKVKELQEKINILMGLYDISQPFIASIKGAVSLVLGNISPAPRKPAGNLNLNQWEKVKGILRKVSLL